MLINIPEDVAQHLESLAQKEGSNIGDILKKLLNRYLSDSPSGSLADMAQNAQDAGLASTSPVYTAENSRDILNTEFADYLKNRMNADSDDDFNG